MHYNLAQFSKEREVFTKNSPLTKIELKYMANLTKRVTHDDESFMNVLYFKRLLEVQ